MSQEILGTCDKNQYEHTGAHVEIKEYGQKLPPFPCLNWKPLPSAPSPAPKCGKPAEPMIPRLGVSRACVLEPGHEGDCRGGGNCFKHGEYVGPQCPQWPDCAKPPFTAQQIESMKAAPSPAEETASGCRCGGTGEVCYSSTSYGPCPECVKRNALPEPVSPEVLGTCADICGPHPEGSHPGCDMWRPGPVSPEGSAERLRRAAQSVGVIVVKDKESLASQVEAIRLIRSVIPESAAPIAPAADELIQELSRALEQIANPITYMRLEVEARGDGAKLNGRAAVELSNDANYLKGIARTALTRAEEYRKGAKNV